MEQTRRIIGIERWSQSRLRVFPATFEVARRNGYEKLFTFVRGDNPAALATYLGQGFAVVGTARDQAKIDGRNIDEIIIERYLVD